MSEIPNDERCCPPDCCDMRGFLTFQILWELRTENLNGQQIAERIWKRRGGNKPTPGTIYPALKELKEKSMITGEKDGNQIIYHLTVEGKAELEDAARYFFQAFGDIIEESKTLFVIKGKCDC
ncbi:MAG: PadR family transcriptional regulator [Candidatus Thorarchaeota archaeon]|nr:PadR family transcriptional regulator [Candidatus Thorarchaeota archaeon]